MISPGGPRRGAVQRFRGVELDDKLVFLAMEAINDQQKWYQVLQHMMTVTGAKAAIITLRDARTCLIVNDDALVNEYHSPLICGFPLEAITYYLQELRTVDTWCEVQRSHYPTRPTLMSRLLDPATAADQRFFSWLRTAGIVDTVVFELEQMQGYWTACNLFLGPQDPETARAVMEFANTHYTFLQKAWQSSQKVLHSEQSRLAAFDQLARMEIAACITGPTGEILRTNSTFEALLARGAVATLGPKRRLAVPQTARLRGEAEWLARARTDMLDEGAPLEIWASPFDPDPLYAEKREPRWFVAVREEGAAGAMPQLAEDGPLTEQERRLFEAVRAGASVADAGVAIGVKRSRAFDIWGEIKLKLGINNAHQVREGTLASKL